VIEPHHLPIASAPGAGERDRMPAITNGSIGIVVPDLAISIGPANDDPTTSRPSGRLTAIIWRIRLRPAAALGQSSESTARLNGSHGPWNSQTNSAIISQPIICIR
jgi:hypothetical protein